MQTEQWTEQVIRQIDQTAMLYHRLILVVAPARTGKTRVLQEVAKRTGFRYLNVNLELSRQLHQRQRQE
jgi:transcription termination factor Rho